MIRFHGTFCSAKNSGLHFRKLSLVDGIWTALSGIPENWITSRGTPSFSKISHRQYPFHLISPSPSVSSICKEWGWASEILKRIPNHAKRTRSCLVGVACNLFPPLEVPVLLTYPVLWAWFENLFDPLEVPILLTFWRGIKIPF